MIAMRMDDGESPAVLLGGLMGGFTLAALFLFGMTGGGYIMGLLMFVLLVPAIGAVALVGMFERQHVAEATPVVAQRAPALAQQRGPAVLAAIVAAAVLTGFYIITMTVTHDWTHTLADLRTDGVAFGLVMLGFAAEAGLLVLLYHSQAPRWWSALAVVAGTGLGTATLMSCCVGVAAATLSTPALTGVTVALVMYKLPLILTSILANAVGIAPLARAAARASAS